MAKVSATAAKELTALVAKLRTQRKEHEDAIAEIDRVFEGLGIESGGGVRRGRKKKATSAKATRGRKTDGRRRRKRGRFKQTADESILAFVKKAGKPTTAEVNKHWQAEGRGGKADNALTKLVQTRKLKRVKDKSVRGSRYTLA